MNSDAPQSEPNPELDEQLVAYLDGELDDETARRIETLVADDPALRDRLAALGQAWELLDELGQTETEESFTEATLELVAIAAEKDAQQREALLPGLRLRRRLLLLAGLLACAAIGFGAVTVLRPNPNRVLLDNLPVVENVDEYLQLLGDQEKVEPSIDFLKQLHQEKLFSDEAPPSEQSSGS